MNERAFRGEPTSRREIFCELEKSALKPLPSMPYEFAEWKKVTANNDYHVEGPDRRYYSVPSQLVHQRLDLRASATTIEVFKDHKRVASLVREYGRRRYVTVPSHMPASHRAHAEWTPSRLVSWANGGGDTCREAPRVPPSSRARLPCLPRSHEPRAQLGDGNERLLAACERALATGATSYSSVKSILKENLDRLPVAGALLTSPVTEHENLRGASPGAFRHGGRPIGTVQPTGSLLRAQLRGPARPLGRQGGSRAGQPEAEDAPSLRQAPLPGDGRGLGPANPESP